MGKPTISTDSDFRARRPIICECGDHAFVAITRGLTTMVSPEDISLLEKRWYAQAYRPGKFRVRRDVRRSGTRKLGRENLAALVLQLNGEVLPDHRSGDALDNRRSNLRPASKSQNSANMTMPRNNTSGFKGVYFQAASGLWRARIGFRGKKYVLGDFKTAEAAGAAYDRAAVRLFGEFARTNAMLTAEAA